MTTESQTMTKPMTKHLLTKATLEGANELDTDQRRSLQHLCDGFPLAQAILPSSIPFSSVIALNREMGDLLIEFDAFDDVPAGGVRVRSGRDNLPVFLAPRLSHDLVAKDLSGLRHLDAKEISRQITQTHDTLMNESSLHGQKYLGGLKDILCDHIIKAKPLEVPSSFMGYSPMELTTSNWAGAISAWAKNTPQGRKTSFGVDPNTAAMALYMTYRDEFRIHEAKSIKESLSRPRSTFLVAAASRLWGEQYTSQLQCEPGKRKGAPRP